MPTTSIPTPSTADVVKLMQDLFGLEITELDPTEPEVFSIAEYVNEQGEVVGYIGCDLATGCRLGAALTQIPSGRVDEAVKEGAIPDNVAENLGEIFNISVSLLAAKTRVVLARTAHGSTDASFAELTKELETHQKTTIGFELERYGKCLLVVGV